MHVIASPVQAGGKRVNSGAIHAVSRTVRPVDPSHTENESTGSALLEIVSDGIVAVDTDGAVLLSNDCFATLIGLSTTILLGATLDDYFLRRDAAMFRKLRVADHQGIQSGDFTLCRIGGTAVPGRISVASLVGAARSSQFGAVFNNLGNELESFAFYHP